VHLSSSAQKKIKEGRSVCDGEMIPLMLSMVSGREKEREGEEERGEEK